MDELLKLLRQNALESPENIASMLGTSEADVKTRIAEYEQKGVIRGYQAIVNEDELELGHVRAVIEIKITPERQGGFNRIAARISKFPNVESLWLMSGTYDLLAFIKGSNLKEVAFFVSDRLATIDGVVATSTHFMLKTYKDQGLLMSTDPHPEKLKVSP